MSDTRKTEKLVFVAINESEIASILRRICREVQDQARGDMTLPGDPKERLVALNMMNNVFDRLDAAVDKYIKQATDSFRVIERK